MSTLQSDLELLYQARGNQVGLVVRIYGKPEAMIARFYKAVKESGDPALANLQFRRSPYNPEEELWIINVKEKSNER